MLSLIVDAKMRIYILSSIRNSYYFLFNLYTYTTQNILGNDCKQCMSQLWEKDQGDKYAEKERP